MRDFQLALSATEFLLECNPDQAITVVQLRRYKCYETTAIIAYTRPFSESRGETPRLSLDLIGVSLDGKQRALHERLMLLRNKVIAHSDSEMMRMAVDIRSVDFGNGDAFPLIAARFDEGLEFVGYEPICEMQTLFNTVYQGVFETLQKDARANPEEFRFRHDYLDGDS
jgi:hypothetical protein